MGPAAGTLEFKKALLRRQFLDPSPFVEYKNGAEVNGYNLENGGFQKPIIVTDKAGLRMEVPRPSFTLDDVVRHTDPDLPIYVIDVERQSDIRLSLGEFVQRFNARPRTCLLNVLSFEYSHTRLASCVNPPHVVKELSLVDNCWSETADDEEDVDHEFSSDKPHVQKYCLMSMAGSYTDFHIDFGGSSVWYHVLWGEKIFYVTPPNKTHLEAYWKWNGLEDNRHVFYPDIGDEPIPVARVHLKAGDTVLLPAGWIHAVYTPKDSLVFGGNFLTQFSIPLQLHVYHMEMEQETEQRFLFPAFEKLHWYAADVILGKLTNFMYSGQDPPAYMIKAAMALIGPLKRWYESRKVLPKSERSYFLPARTYLQYSHPTVISKLEDAVKPFLMKSTLFSNKQRQRRRRSPKIRRGSSSRSEECDAVESDSTDPQMYPSEGEQYEMLTTSSSAVSISRKSMKKRQSRKTTQDSEEEALHEVLDVVPELRNSNLVNDQYVFLISESAEEAEGGGRRKQLKAKTSAPGMSNHPTLQRCASSSSTKTQKSGPTRGKMPPQLSGRVFPIPRNVSRPLPSMHSTNIGDQVVPSTSEIRTSRVGKNKMTVRQRLARRFGLK